MKLSSIELQNFRQFAGTQKIEFATGEDRNVTLVYSANGGGKTTLLNAFTWALYGTTTADFEQSDHLVTDSVWDDAETGTTLETSVAVTFEHGNTQYRLKRRVTTRKEGGRQQPPQTIKVQLTCMEPSGAWKEVEAHSERIDQILPQELSHFFFFNGERIERMVQRDAYAEIKNAIKTLLGLEQYEIALKYLPEVSRRLRAELKKLGSSQAGKIVSEQDDVRDAVERLEDEQQRVNANMRLLSDEMEKVRGLLRANAPAAQLQKRRDEQERAYNAALEREKQARGERRKLLGGGAYKVMFAKFLPEVEEAATGLRERGQLPAPLKRQFVDELLESKTCICGTDLVPGKDPHEHVSRWRAKAGLAEVEGAWQQLQGRLKDVVEAAEGLPDRLRKLNGDMATSAEEARQASEIVSEVSAQIKKLPAEDAQLLEDRRTTLERKIDEAKLRLHDIERELREKEERAAELRKLLAKVELTDQQSARIRHRIEVNDQAHATLHQMYDAAGQFVRGRLDHRIRQVFSRIAVKSFYPELNSSFELQLWKGNGEDRFPAPKSTGENQILSLSFIGALVALCRERADEGTHAKFLGSLGGLYPIVMDAPFGNLDNNYRHQIARALPSLAPQVVVFSSAAQAEGVVADALEARVGAKYVVTMRTTKTDTADEPITIDGISFDYIVASADADIATIEKVR